MELIKANKRHLEAFQVSADWLEMNIALEDLGFWKRGSNFKGFQPSMLLWAYCL